MTFGKGWLRSAVTDRFGHSMRGYVTLPTGTRIATVFVPETEEHSYMPARRWRGGGTTLLVIALWALNAGGLVGYVVLLHRAIEWMRKGAAR